MAKAWMPFYIADYLADTGHLTTEQHGAFVLSLFHYWQSNQPLPANALQLQMICRCMDAAKFVQIWDVVSMFYIRDGDSWRNTRMDKELAKAHKLSEIRAKAANVRHSKSHAKAPAIAMQKQTQSQSQSRKPKTEIPEWIDRDVWLSFIEMRVKLKAPMTEKAKSLAFSKLEKFKESGHNVNDIINESVMNGWKSFFVGKEASSNTDHYDKDIYK